MAASNLSIDAGGTRSRNCFRTGGASTSDDNTTQRLTLNEAPAWRPGDRVRVVGGALRPL